jgi:TRAP-type C4-dicarboxylate transport system permease small subunit
MVRRYWNGEKEVIAVRQIKKIIWIPALVFHGIVPCVALFIFLFFIQQLRRSLHSQANLGIGTAKLSEMRI